MQNYKWYKKLQMMQIGYLILWKLENKYKINIKRYTNRVILWNKVCYNR